ncbi:MAG TPA: hypothetical protein VJ725_19870 [Thermoanaerobaculia bacterium]|nr:hypothetical protein [Thermoanaerobaculia bacterium]
MSSGQLVGWGEEPGALELAQAEVLFLLAGSLRNSWPDLYKATRYFNGTWVQYINGIAEVFRKDIAAVSSRADVVFLWSQFEKTLLVQKSPKEVRALLDQVGQEIGDRLGNGGDPLLDLAERNVRACTAVRGLLKSFGVEQTILLPVPVLLIPDAHRGQSPLAWTMPGRTEIRWALQREPRAFWAALAVQSVLEHEYLSHLAPKSHLLSPSVREEWLMAVLLLDVQRRSNADHRLLWYLRYRLGGIGELTMLRLPDAASTMSSYEPYSKVYRRFNRELLSLPADPGAAARADEILELLDTSPPEVWGRLLGGSWDGSIAGFPQEFS